MKSIYRQFGGFLCTNGRLGYLCRPPAGVILVLVFFLCGDLLSLAATAPNKHVLHLKPDKEHYFLGPYLFYLEDAENKFSVEDVSSPLISSYFSKNTGKSLNLGVDSSSYWIRFSVALSEVVDSHKKWLLYFGWPNLIDYATLYVPTSSDTGWLSKEMGRILPTGPDPLPSTPYNFLPSDSVPQPITFYLRVKSSDWKHIPLQILTDEAYKHASRRRSLWLDIYYGIMLAMFLYNLIWVVTLRELNRLYYLLYLTFIGLMFLTMNGLLVEFFHLGFHPNQVLIYVFMCIGFFWANLFAKSFLVTKKHVPFLDKLLSICMVLALVLSVLIPFSNLSQMMFAVISQNFFVPPIFLIAGFTVWRRGFRPARFFLIAFTMLALSAIYEALIFFNVLPFFNKYIAQFFSAIEVILLQLALADRFRTLSQEQDKIKQSLYLAREVQQNLLPGKVPKIDKLDIAGKSIYCDETGGDYYDFILGDTNGNEQIGIALGDVSGHGISSALLMAAVRSSLRQRLSMSGDLGSIISDVNHQLVQDVENSGQFMTMFYLTIDRVNQNLKWVRAGHEPGIFYDPATDTFEDLKGPGIALGVSDDWQYEMNERMGLAKGQIIVLSTDGVWEAHNLDGEIFGKERLNEIIRQNATKKAEEIIEAVVVALSQFQKDSAIEDDITLVVIKIEQNLVNSDKKK